jgi:Ca2+-binding RTX toxin-like protein
VETIKTSDPENGGDDTIHGNEDVDRILGGNRNDTIFGDAQYDIIIGDHGIIDYASDGDLASVDAIWTTQPTLGGQDYIEGNGDDDIILGGTASDTIHGNAGIDLIFGDQGEVLSSGGANRVVTYHTETPPWYEGYTYTATVTQNDDAGAGDYIYGEAGGDYILGQQGTDVIFGGSGDDDIYGGHNVAEGHDTVDLIDGGTDNDVIAGDNASIQRTDGAVSPRFRVLQGSVIYGEDFANDSLPLVTAAWQQDPNGAHVREVVLFDHSHTPDSTTFGDDVIAGGADDDMIFGQLGNDTLHGDGQITDPAPHELLALTGATCSDRGDDYIEGNGGDDTIYGGLGQDDIIGGSSNFFGLNTPGLRPDGSDLIFGGNGDLIARNDLGNLSLEGHACDADMILGDNGNIYRLVRLVDLVEGLTLTEYLEFNYDNPDFGYSTFLKIVPRAADLIDYTPGGLDYFPTAGQAEYDIGAADVIHGEAGDDIIYGMKGDDIIYGEGQDDNIMGGYDNDWISGGTGNDGILGDDGRIYTSRNGFAEPLYGIGDLSGELDKYIYTPGKIQQSIINVSGELKKTVNLTPFKWGPMTPIMHK